MNINNCHGIVFDRVQLCLLHLESMKLLLSCLLEVLLVSGTSDLQYEVRVLLENTVELGFSPVPLIFDFSSFCEFILDLHCTRLHIIISIFR